MESTFDDGTSHSNGDAGEEVVDVAKADLDENSVVTSDVVVSEIDIDETEKVPIIRPGDWFPRVLVVDEGRRVR